MMKVGIKRIISVLLAVTMLASIACVPAFAEKNSNTIYLSTKFVEPEKDDAIESVASGATFEVQLNFSGNPTTTIDSIQGYDICIGYDPAKMEPEASYPGLTSPTINLQFGEGVIYLACIKFGK